MSLVALDVAADTPLWDAFPQAQAVAARAVAVAAERAGVTLLDGVEASLLLTSDARMRDLNRQWRAKDKPTNVLSFPAVGADKLASTPFLGDIAIAYETLEREAGEEGKPLSAHYTHLVVHGFLHLLGHDHVAAAEAERMEGVEIAVLAALGIADPYRDGSLDDASASVTMVARP